MKLYQVYNGFMAESPIYVIVVAENEERANELASREFKENVRNRNYDPESMLPSRQEEFNYDASYWTDLGVHLLKDDLTVESVGQVEE